MTLNVSWTLGNRLRVTQTSELDTLLNLWPNIYTVWWRSLCTSPDDIIHIEVRWSSSTVSNTTWGLLFVSFRCLGGRGRRQVMICSLSWSTGDIWLRTRAGRWMLSALSSTPSWTSWDICNDRERFCRLLSSPFHRGVNTTFESWDCECCTDSMPVSAIEAFTCYLNNYFYIFHVNGLLGSVLHQRPAETGLPSLPPQRKQSCKIKKPLEHHFVFWLFYMSRYDSRACR